MSQRSIQKCTFAGYLLLFGIGQFIQIAHGLQPDGYNDKNNPYIFGQGQQQFSKIFCFEGYVFLIQFFHTLQAVHDGCDRCVEFLVKFFGRNKFIINGFDE